MSSSKSGPGHQNVPHGAGRSVLRLLVRLDSSRFLGSRLAAGLSLISMLAMFAAIGYGVPALLSAYL